MEDLRLTHTEFLYSVNINPKANQSTQQIMKEARCFFCDQTNHWLGLKFCLEVEVCIKEGLVAYTPLSRLPCPDGSELPQAFGNDSRVAKVLQEQHAASSHLKGKAWEASRDLPPHMANYASFCSMVRKFYPPKYSMLLLLRLSPNGTLLLLQL